MSTRATATDLVINPGRDGRLGDAEAAPAGSTVEGFEGVARRRVLARWRALVAARRGRGATGLPGREQRDPVDRGAAAIAVYHAFR